MIVLNTDDICVNWAKESFMFRTIGINLGATPAMRGMTYSYEAGWLTAECAEAKTDMEGICIAR